MTQAHGNSAHEDRTGNDRRGGPPSRLNRAAGVVAALSALALGGLGAWIATAYLTEYGEYRYVAIGAGAGVAVVGACLGIGIARSRRRGVGILALSILTLAAGVVGCSVAYGRITHASFGLTVIGVIPVPVLDIVIDRRGIPWFRDKTHRIERREIEALRPDAETVVIIGAGWQGGPVVDEECRGVAPATVLVLPTPEAVARYNLLRAEGRKVVLLLHSTC